MTRQKYLTKKYLEQKILNELYDITGAKNFDELLTNNLNTYEDDLFQAVVYFLEEVEEEILLDFEISKKNMKEKKSIFLDLSIDLLNDKYRNLFLSKDTTQKVFIDTIYNDFIEEYKLETKDIFYYFKVFKEKVIEPNSWNWIIFVPLGLIGLIIVLMLIQMLFT